VCLVSNKIGFVTVGRDYRLAASTLMKNRSHCRPGRVLSGRWCVRAAPVRFPRMASGQLGCRRAWRRALRNGTPG